MPVAIGIVEARGKRRKARLSSLKRNETSADAGKARPEAPATGNHASELAPRDSRPAPDAGTHVGVFRAGPGCVVSAGVLRLSSLRRQWPVMFLVRAGAGRITSCVASGSTAEKLGWARGRIRTQQKGAERWRPRSPLERSPEGQRGTGAGASPLWLSISRPVRSCERPKFRGTPRNLPPMAGAAGPTEQGLFPPALSASNMSYEACTYSQPASEEGLRARLHLHLPCDVKRCSLDINRAPQRRRPFHPLPPPAPLPLPSFTMTIFDRPKPPSFRSPSLLQILSVIPN